MRYIEEKSSVFNECRTTKPKKVNISYCVSIHSINIGLLGVSVAVILGAIVIRKCNINTIRSIFLWIRVSLVKSISKRINLKSLKKFLPRTILSGAGLRGGSAAGLYQARCWRKSPIVHSGPHTQFQTRPGLI